MVAKCSDGEGDIVGLVSYLSYLIYDRHIFFIVLMSDLLNY